MEKICGIYKITSPSNKIYIGQSVDIKNRWSKYKNTQCEKQEYLYRSLKKYGVNKHKFEIINQCSETELNEKEKYYIKLYQTFNSEYGLNLTNGGYNRWCFSDSVRKKMSISRKGKKLSQQTILKLIKIKKDRKDGGWVMSEETKQKIRETLKSKKLSEDTKSRLRNMFKGRRHSEEAKRKMSEIKKGNQYWLGKKHSEESKQKMIIAQKNRPPVSEETKQKLRIFNIGKKQSEETIIKRKKSIKKKKENGIIYKKRAPFTEQAKLNMSICKRGKMPKNISQIAGWNKGKKMNSQWIKNKITTQLNNFKNRPLDKNETNVLTLKKNNPNIRICEISKQTGLIKYKVDNILQGLKKRNYLN